MQIQSWLKESGKGSHHSSFSLKITSRIFSISISIFYFCSTPIKTERNKQTYRTIAEEEKLFSFNNISCKAFSAVQLDSIAFLGLRAAHLTFY